MFKTFTNNSRTWQLMLQNKQVTKNNYRVTNDLKKAKAFVTIVSNFDFSYEFETKKEFVIFSNDLLGVPLAYAFAFSL
jgi:hypothetical protein